MEQDCIYLFDVDNTLLDADSFVADFHAYLKAQIGAEHTRRYWETYLERRKRLGYSDYLGAVQELRAQSSSIQNLLPVSSYLRNYPFAQTLYADALKVLRQFQQYGQTVLFSEGDAVFQPHKILRSGLWDAVDGRVLIYPNKLHMLNEVARKYPAKHYVVVDDKPSVLTAMKLRWRDRVTTVAVRQGQFAQERSPAMAYPNSDLTLDHIGEMLDYEFSENRTTAEYSAINIAHPERQLH